MELSGSDIKTILIVFQKKAFFIFWKTESPIKLFVSGNGNLKKTFYISGNRIFLYFGKSIFRTLVFSEP